MYTFLESKFHENFNGDIYFLPQITIFEKITKNTFFAIFFSKLARKKSKFRKFILKGFTDLKH